MTEEQLKEEARQYINLANTYNTKEKDLTANFCNYTIAMLKSEKKELLRLTKLMNKHKDKLIEYEIVGDFMERRQVLKRCLSYISGELIIEKQGSLF